MRDSWDDQYVEKVRSLNYNCDLVLSFKKLFFGTGVNKYVEDEILNHLCHCEKCRNEYTRYAKQVGYKKWSLAKYAVSFVQSNKDLKECKTRTFVEEMKSLKKVEILSKPWTRAANMFNLDKLMNMRVFYDLCREYKSPTKDDHSQFVKYIVLKNAKYIDHLEECLMKEFKEDEV